jgi:small-conductance mechanosensitive channel
MAGKTIMEKIRERGMSDQSFIVQKMQRSLSSGLLLLSLLAGIFISLSVAAAAPGPAAPATETLDAEAPVAIEPATLSFFNRDILIMRGTQLGHPPEVRVRTALAFIHDALDEPGAPVVTLSPREKNINIELNGRMVFTVSPQDVDTFTEETTESLAKAAADRLREAISEYEAQHESQVIWKGAGKVAIATIFLILLLRTLLWLNAHVQREWLAWLAEKLERARAALGKGGSILFQGQWPLTALHLASKVLTLLLSLVLIDVWLLFCFDSFPYTRPWKEEILGFIVRVSAGFFSAIINAIPGLVTAALIFWLVWLAVRVSKSLFRPVESGEVSLSWLDQDTAPTTRKLVGLVFWLFGIVMAYPYLPGAHTEAFKGISVLVGLMISLGASSVVGQIVSGFILIYAKVFRPGDYVRVSDNEGMVNNIGMFATRIRTVSGIEISLPNTSVLSNAVTNYSRSDMGAGPVIETKITIGYDTPWRQVHAMLLEAAARIPEILSTPKPTVIQTALSDFYVEYRLAGVLSPNSARKLPIVRSDLHGSIQDTFNRYGVQIMSPNYIADPATEKIVSPENWAPPPAKADS